jgi:hypothetical protein
MQRFLGGLVIVAILIGAFGFYRGWFSFSKTNADNSTNLTIQVNKDKIKEDEEKAKEELKAVGHTIKKDVKQLQTKDDSK